jgi:flavin-dependent dehydrogenase
VVVVGANVAGASTARELATRGLRVALVERNPAADVGSRSCGDGIERYQFEKLGLPLPEGEFILREVPVAYLNSPNRKVRLRGVAAGIAIDRFGLNQHLLSEAQAVGVELLDSTEAMSPTVEEGRVVGVVHRSRTRTEVGSLTASVVVDATGWWGKLRRQVPSEWPLRSPIGRRGGDVVR